MEDAISKPLNEWTLQEAKDFCDRREKCGGCPLETPLWCKQHGNVSEWELHWWEGDKNGQPHH